MCELIIIIIIRHSCNQQASAFLDAHLDLQFGTNRAAVRYRELKFSVLSQLRRIIVLFKHVKTLNGATGVVRVSWGSNRHVPCGWCAHFQWKYFILYWKTRWQRPNWEQLRDQINFWFPATLLEDFKILKKSPFSFFFFPSVLLLQHLHLSCKTRLVL